MIFERNFFAFEDVIWKEFLLYSNVSNKENNININVNTVFLNLKENFSFSQISGIFSTSLYSLEALSP